MGLLINQKDQMDRERVAWLGKSVAIGVPTA